MQLKEHSPILLPLLGYLFLIYFVTAHLGFTTFSLTLLFLSPIVIFGKEQLMPFAITLGLAFTTSNIVDLFPELHSFRVIFLLGAMLGVICLSAVIKNKTIFFLTREHKILIALVLLLIPNIFFSSSRMVSLELFTGAVIKLFLFFFLVSWTFNTRLFANKLMEVVTVLGIIISLHAIENKLLGTNLVEGSRASIPGTSFFSDPNHLALMLLFPFTCAATKLLEPGLELKHKLISLLGAPLILMAILVTQSRGGFLGLAMILFGLFAHKIKHKIRFIIIFGVIITLLFGLAGISERKIVTHNLQNIDASAQSRLDTWASGIQMALNNPLSGVGIGAFADTTYLYQDNFQGKALSAHSMWFSVLGERGFISFILFLCLFYSFIKKAYQCYKYYHSQPHTKDPPVESYFSKVLLLSLAGICVSGSFLSIENFFLPYVLGAMTLALHRQMTLEQNI